MITEADVAMIGRTLKPIIQQMIEDAWTRPLQVFTVSNKPSATDNKWLWRLAIVSDGASNKKLMFCDGANWRYPDGTTV